jgi:hypothetical protein
VRPLLSASPRGIARKENNFNKIIKDSPCATDEYVYKIIYEITPNDTSSLEHLEAMLHDLEVGLPSIAERLNHLEQIISK